MWAADLFDRQSVHLGGSSPIVAADSPNLDTFVKDSLTVRKLRYSIIRFEVIHPGVAGCPTLPGLSYSARGETRLTNDQQP